MRQDGMEVGEGALRLIYQKLELEYPRDQQEM